MRSRVRADGAAPCVDEGKHAPQLVLQELGNKKAYSVSVGSAREGGCGIDLVPAQLGTEPLEEANLLR